MIRSLIPVVLVAALILSVGAAEPSARLAELRKERTELNRAIRKAVPDPNKEDAELEKLQRESIDASKAYQQAIDDHPNLKTYKIESTAATAKLTEAIVKKDETAKEAAQQEISAVMNRRMEAAGKEADLKPLADAAQASGDAYRARLTQFLASHPATKDHAAKLAQVQAAIAEEMKKQTGN